jgi:hypothetical protein
VCYLPIEEHLEPLAVKRREFIKPGKIGWPKGVPHIAKLDDTLITRAVEARDKPIAAQLGAGPPLSTDKSAPAPRGGIGRL